METVYMIERRFERAVSYGKKVDEGQVRRSDEKMARVEKSGPYEVRDGIAITMDEMALAADMLVCRSSTAGFASVLADILKLSSIKIFWHLCAR